MIEWGLPWETWEPMYATILADFGFGRGADETARDELAELLDPIRCSPGDLPDATGATVAVVGGGRISAAGLERARAADLRVVASDGAAPLDDVEIPIDVHVTDLDESLTIPAELTHRGVPVAVHAHGDNRETLRSQVPTMDHNRVLPTTQAEPQSGVYNPGGFTDGDRAAFVAHTMGAETLTFAGWRFDDPTVSSMKRQKLAWAARLLHWLERHRGEQFGVLEGRRDGLSLAGFPAP